MDLKLSEEQSILKETVRSFILKEFTKDYISQLCLNKEYPPEFDKRIAELGVFGISFPEKYNGSNLGPMEVAIVIEELSRYSIDLGISYGLNLLGGLTILNFGNEVQKNKYLPEIIKGDLSFSLGYYEPFLFNDLSKINGYLSINEGKLKITGNSIYSERRDPDKNLILFPLNTEEKLTFLILPQTLLGKGEILNTLGRDLLGIVKYSIKEINCGKEHLLNYYTNGEKILNFLVNWMKFINFMSCIGNMETVITDTINYSKEREQFGRPIGTFQSLMHLIVDTKVKIDTSRLFGYWIAYLMAKAQNNSLSSNGILKEINMANSYITQAFVDAANTGLQVMGGFGYTLETNMERYTRDARLTTYFIEDNFLQKLLIAEKLGINI